MCRRRVCSIDGGIDGASVFSDKAVFIDDGIEDAFFGDIGGDEACAPLTAALTRPVSSLTGFLTDVGIDEAIFIRAGINEASSFIGESSFVDDGINDPSLSSGVGIDEAGARLTMARAMPVPSSTRLP